MLSVWKHWAAQTPQLHVYSSDHLCELHPYVLYFKRPFQLLLSFHSEIPFKSGLRAWVCFFNPHIVGTGHGNFPHCACSGYPVPRWNAECWLSECRALCELTTSVHFDGGQREHQRHHQVLCLWFLQGIGGALCCRVHPPGRNTGSDARQQWVTILVLLPFLYETWANY